jgi:hypothetical protein
MARVMSLSVEILRLFLCVSSPGLSVVIHQYPFSFLLQRTVIVSLSPTPRWWPFLVRGQNTNQEAVAVCVVFAVYVQPRDKAFATEPTFTIKLKQTAGS